VAFFAPLAIGLGFEETQPQPAVWAFVFGVGCIVGIAFPLRNRFSGVSRLAVRLVLYFLLALATFVWLGFEAMAIRDALNRRG